MIKKISLRNYSLVIGMSALLIFLDQFSKMLVIQNFKAGTPVALLGDLLKINLVYNDSAAFSFGFGATSVFAVISALAALALLWYARRVETTSWAVLLGVALGGVVGNLIDRLTRSKSLGNGQVVDFIQIPFNFPIFNIADSAIVIVALVTIVRVMRGDRIGKARTDDRD